MNVIIAQVVLKKQKVGETDPEITRINNDLIKMSPLTF